MPIYSNTYREYDGRPRRWFRWLVVVEQELKTLAKFRVFKMLYLLAFLHIIVRMLQVVAYDVMAQDPNNPLQAVVAQDPYGQGFQAMTLLINAIKGEDYSATKGKTTYLDGIVMSKTDLEGVQKWIDDNK